MGFNLIFIVIVLCDLSVSVNGGLPLTYCHFDKKKCELLMMVKAHTILVGGLEHFLFSIIYWE